MFGMVGQWQALVRDLVDQSGKSTLSTMTHVLLSRGFYVFVCIQLHTRTSSDLEVGLLLAEVCCAF